MTTKKRSTALLSKNPNFFTMLTGLLLLLVIEVNAQKTNVPRTRTFSGLVSPAFPYVQPETVGLSRGKLDWLGDEISSWVVSGELVGAELLIIKNEKTIFHEAYGWSNREERIPVERNSIWSIKSMSKPFTATAILMLAEQGTLSLEDPVSRYIPAFAGDKRTTIHHLLSHTSGYRDEDLGDPTTDHESLSEWVEDWASRTPTGTFGTYEYTDFGFAASGYILEVVTGVPISTFTKEHIIRPLDLRDTGTGFSSDPAWRARLNPWYRWNERAGAYDLRWASNRAGWAFYPAAWGMFSTAMDYAVFMEMWMNKGEWRGMRLLSEQTVKDALQPHGRIGEFSTYGYGWYLNEIEGVAIRPFGHGGGDGTDSWAFPADDAIVVFLTHSRQGPHSEAFWNRVGISGLFEHYPGFALDWEPMALAIKADSLETEISGAQRAGYSGTYQNEEQDNDAFKGYRVWEENSRLNIGIIRTGTKTDLRFHLVPLDNDRFLLGRYDESGLRAIDPNYEVRFILNEDVAAALEFIKDSQVLVTAQKID